MPKVRKHSSTSGAVLARERRKREKQEREYDSALKELIVYKYSHIIDEFEPFHKQLLTNRPASIVYTNTNEYQLWRKSEIKKYFSQNNNDKDEQQQNVEMPEPEVDVGQQNVEPEVEVDQQNVEPEVEVDQQNVEPEVEVGAEVEVGQQNVEDLLAQLVNGLVEDDRQQDDEGIDLDLWEELQGDIHDFDYRLEVELDQYL